ncbi:hypothetical protein [Dactylosporangium sp. NPDC000521]|uniref:hypothetical protein n=1 Tax=Dactylosporangium sp. NPDC000521 TaxID=3363975 RepID=UPI00367E5E8B
MGQGSRRWAWSLLVLGLVAFGVRYEDPRSTTVGYQVAVEARWPQTEPAHWVQVFRFDPTGQVLTGLAERPPGAGEAVEVTAGPDRMVVVVAEQVDRCGSLLFRFRLSADGQVRGLTPIAGGPVPAEIAGVAISPDRRQLGYAARPCSGEGISLVVHQLTTGDRRTWSASGGPLIGEIVWAGDNRTLGYAVTDPALTGIAVHALDTRAAGDDLRAGRVLFRARTSDGTIRMAVMNSDGRSGFAIRETDEGTDSLAFTAGEPARVVQHTPRDPNVLTAFAYSFSGPRRFACLTSIDAFGGIDSRMRRRSPSSRCTTAWVS